jgi:hypothetical protein
MRWQSAFWSLSIAIAASSSSIGNWCVAGGCGCERAPAPTCSYAHHCHHRHCHACQPPTGVLVQSAPVMQAPMMAPVQMATMQMAPVQMMQMAPVQMMQMAPVSYAPVQYQAAPPAAQAPPAAAPTTCAGSTEVLKRLESMLANAPAASFAPPTPIPEDSNEQMAAEIKELRMQLRRCEALLRQRENANQDGGN